MNNTLIQMTVLLLCGAVWGRLRPGGLSAAQTRIVLTSVVYYFFLPAMVLQVLWHTQLGWQSVQYSVLTCVSVVSSLILCWLIAKLFNFSRAKTGAILLAAAFPNVTYLGLPVLEQTFGSWVRSVVIQIDLFAIAPLVYTLGIVLARYYGEVDGEEKPKHLLAFLTAPPFLALFLAVSLNLNHLLAPQWLDGLLQTCASAVSPLMIFSVGMALDWRSVHCRNLPYMLPLLLIKLGFMPLVALSAAGFMDMSSQHKAAAVMDLAMPSMILGIVLCDRYKLDSSLYASAVSLTTALSLLTLPFWYSVL